jgi:hypothetical protein
MGRLRVRVLSLALSCVFLICDVPAAAQSPPVKSVTCRIGAPDGVRRYRPGSWGIVEVYATNQTSEEAEAQAVIRFVDDPTLQYGRRVSVPPNSTLRSTCPILIPEFISGQTRHVNCLTEQVLPPPDQEARQLSPQDAMLASQPIILDHEAPAVAMIADLDESATGEDGVPYYTGTPVSPSAPDDLVYEMVVAAKRAEDLTRRVSILEAVDLPPDPASLDVIDVLVVSSDRLAFDPAGVALVRDWVLGGGHLWIMLDEVRPDTVAAVMGDAFASTIIDRVQLTQLRIQNARYDMMEQPFEDIEMEEPVELVRVIPEGVTVTTTVGGWPAAFWQPFGAGRVFFTTLGTAAWIRPTTSRDPSPKIPGEDTAFFARQPLADIAEECFVPRSAPELGAAALQPFLAQQIGYRILSRQAVAAILTVFCASLVVAGCWFARIGRLEHLLWIAPVAAVITSVVFLAVAIATKRSVPPTVATIARVVLEPGVSTGHSFGLAAMYNQDACRELLGAERGGIFYPDMTAMSGRHRRVVWTDEGAWHWEDLELPAGVRTAPFEYRISLDKTVDCRARFGPAGLQGSVDSLPFTRLEDAIIALPHQNAMTVKIGNDGTFACDVGDVLTRGEFLAGTLLGDRRRRRQTVYEQVFKTQPEIDAPAIPVLFAWADAADMGFIFPQSNRRGSTLLSIRLRLEESPAGTQVAVPAPFLPYQAIADPEGRPPAAYSNVMRTWVDSKLAMTEWLRFALPREVLPIRLSRATLSLTARVPSRSLEVLAFADREPVVVMKLSHPIGTYSCVLDRPELLQLDDTGGLRLAVRVSEDEAAQPGDLMALVAWRIDSLQLELAGTVQGE